MSARTKRRAGRRRRPGAARIAVIAAAFAAAAAIAWFAVPRRAAKPTGALPLSSIALAESVRAAESARDWARFLVYLEQLAALEPSSAEHQLALGVAWNNFAWAGGPGERSGARTSLERIRFERRAFQCLDSAAALARGTDEAVRIRLVRGRFYEALGLPLDALAQYQDAIRRLPGNPETSGRITRVARQLGESGGPAPPER